MKLTIVRITLAVLAMLMLGYALYTVIGWTVVLVGLVAIPLYIGLAWWVWRQFPPVNAGNPFTRDSW